MIVQCPECNQKVHLEDGNIKTDRFLIVCSHCGAYVQVHLNVTVLKLYQPESNQGDVVSLDRTSVAHDLRRDPVYLNNPEDSLVRFILDKFIKGEFDMPSLPSLYLEISQLARNENTASRDMADIIANDEKLVKCVIELAKKKSSKVVRNNDRTNLTYAIERVGFKTVERMAFAQALHALFLQAPASVAAVMETEWDNNLTCGVAAFEIASAVSYGHEDLAFVAGLFKGVGALCVSAIISRLSEEDACKLDVSQAKLTELFAQLNVPLGCKLAHSWNMPAPLIRTIAYSYNLEEYEDFLVDIAGLAESICIKLGKSLNPNPDLSLMPLISTQRLEITDVKMANLLIDLEDNTRAMQALIG